MRYVIRTTLGMALFAFCWVSIGYGIHDLLQVGTCASGGPYEIARECPDGIGRMMVALLGGIFGLFLAMPVYGTRGAPPGTDRKPANAGILIWFWTGLFWSLAIGCFVGVWGPDANPGPGGKEGGLIVGFMGLVMGAGGFLAIDMPWRRNKKRNYIAEQVLQGTRDRGREKTERKAEVPKDSVERLETLDRLRRQGTLSDAEFETLKARILRGEH